VEFQFNEGNDEDEESEESPVNNRDADDVMSMVSTIKEANKSKFRQFVIYEAANDASRSKSHIRTEFLL